MGLEKAFRRANEATGIDCWSGMSEWAAVVRKLHLASRTFRGLKFRGHNIGYHCAHDGHRRVLQASNRGLY